MNERRRTEQCIQVQEERARVIRQQLACPPDLRSTFEEWIRRALMEERLREIDDRLRDFRFILGYGSGHEPEEPDRGGSPEETSA